MGAENKSQTVTLTALPFFEVGLLRNIPHMIRASLMLRPDAADYAYLQMMAWQDFDWVTSAWIRTRVLPREAPKLAVL